MAEQIQTAENTEVATAAAEEVSENAEAHNDEGEALSFTDGDTDGGRSKEGTDKGEDKANSDYAFRRREAERRAREIEAARVNAIIEAVGENPFTHEEIKDAEDVAEYLAMKEIQKQGGDPVSDYAKHQKARLRATKAQEAEAERQNEWYRNDREDFIKKYPDVNLSKLIADKGFAEFAEGKVGQKPLAEIYEGYERFVKAADKKATEKAAQALANSKASPGALSGGSNAETEYFTYEQVKAMSQAEVKKNYEKIRKSMKSWKK